MAAAAAPPSQRWEEFNLDLWRAAQPRATRRSQRGVGTGAADAWNALTPAQQGTVIASVDRWTNIRTRLDATMANPSPLPDTVPDTDIRPTLQDFFERGYDVSLSRRSIAQELNTIMGIVQHGAVQARLVASHDQAQDEAATSMAAIGAMRDYTRRLRLAEALRIDPAGPTILTPPTPTYDEDREYLDRNLDRLIERKDNLQALLNDINTEIQARTGNDDVVPRGERLYLSSHRDLLQIRIPRLTLIVDILRRWFRDVDAEDDEPMYGFGLEPDVQNELEDFIAHFDGIKDFEDALGRMTNCYASRFPNQPDMRGTEVEIIFPSIDRCHQQHTIWFNAVKDEVDRLRGLFNTHWSDFDALTANQQATINSQAMKALRQREARNVDLSGSWMGPMFLGAGSHGSASVWIKQDANGRISDRVTVKDTNNANPNYLNTTAVVQPPEFMPMEAVAMLKLMDLPGSSSVVNIRNWRSKMFFQGSAGYRIYMEFCSGGDLWTQFRDFWPSSQTFMPEPYLWAIFDSLVTAGLLMEGDHLRDAARTLWDQIVHGDMKPDNVFLSENNSATFRGFPLAKLGDFGLATLFPQRDITPLTSWRAFSGPGYRAPEMAKTYSQAGIAAIGSYSPRSAANVWGVGLIMRDIMHENPLANLWQGGSDAPPGEPFIPWKPSDFTAPAEILNYSARLRDLIMSCLEVLPTARPTFRQLRDRILAEVGPDGTDARLARLRDADPEMDARFLDAGPPASVDKYAVGLAIEDLPADVLPASRFRDPPVVTSPVDVTVGGPTGMLAPGAEHENAAVAEFVRSVRSRKRTFDKISED